MPCSPKAKICGTSLRHQPRSRGHGQNCAKLMGAGWLVCRSPHEAIHRPPFNRTPPRRRRTALNWTFFFVSIALATKCGFHFIFAGTPEVIYRKMADCGVDDSALKVGGTAVWFSRDWWVSVGLLWESETFWRGWRYEAAGCIEEFCQFFA